MTRHDSAYCCLSSHTWDTLSVYASVTPELLRPLQNRTLLTRKINFVNSANKYVMVNFCSN